MVLHIILRRVLCTLLILSAFKSILPAQQTAPAEFRIRLAQSYERSGDYESAVKILTELLRTNPANAVLADELRRDLLQLKKYPETIDLIHQQLKQRPSDISLLCDLGTVYYLNSQESTAVATWERVIAIQPKESITYHIVGGAMTGSRLYDRAIGVYLRGRDAAGQPQLFINELAFCYTVTAHYAEATGEYLSLLRQSPSQLPYVQSSIATYTNYPDGLASATKVIEQASAVSAADVSVQRILAWIYMEGKHYDRAHSVYKTIDDQTKAGGGELFLFAERALHDRSYGIAAATYREIVERYRSFDRLPEAKFGYARATEGTAGETDSLRLFGFILPSSLTEQGLQERSETILRAIAGYQQVIEAYPKTDVGAASLLRIGILKQEILSDVNGARASFETLLQLPVPAPAVMQEAGLRLGDIYLVLGDAEKAVTQFSKIAGKGLRTNGVQEQAAFRLAEVQYFQTHFDSSLSLLRDLARNTGSDIANDAIGLQIFIQQHLQNDKPALTEIARADLLRRQQKFSEALTAYQAIPKAFPKSDLLDDALGRTGDVYAVMKNYPAAVAAYEQLLAGDPENIAFDETLMKAGQVYQFGLKDPAKAISAYEQLLTRYPSSIYAGEARKRIRTLRGDTI
jgi:tetratricopeptide (TPR) repeat protein